MRSPSSNRSIDVDPNVVAEVVERYPVELAVLFGSHARDTASPGSDVDVAVAFAGDRSPSERLELRIELVVDLVEALGTDAVDVADFDSIRPAVGASALDHGTVLVGDGDALEAARDRFDDEPDESHEERMERFDSILDRLEADV